MSQPHHFKIDVDGVEFDIVKGAENLLLSSQFRSLNLEIDESVVSSKEITRYIESLDFTFYKKYTDVNAEDLEHNLCKIYNYFFVKNKKHDFKKE